MMNPGTVIQRMKLAASAKPSAKYKLILATSWDLPEKDYRYGFMSTQMDSLDKIVAKLFDLSMQGYFVHEVRTIAWDVDLEYYIELKFSISRQLMSNIDGDVVQSIVEVMNSAN